MFLFVCGDFLNFFWGDLSGDRFQQIVFLFELATSRSKAKIVPVHSEQYVFPRSDKGRNFFKKVNVVFAVRFAINPVFAHVSAKEAFRDNIRHDLAEYLFHVDWDGTLGDFLIDLVELETNFLPDGRDNFIKEIVMKDGWDDSSFAFPSVPFSKNHSSTGKSVEDLSD